jgi:hypothetical protein
VAAVDVAHHGKVGVYGGGCAAASVEEGMRQPSARPSLYTPKKAEGHDTLGNGINFLGRGGSGRAVRHH